MDKKTLIKKITLWIIFTYTLACVSLYALQKKMFFPVEVTKPVSTKWQPNGRDSQHSLIGGECGKIHVAMWRIPNAKGTIMMFHGNGESLSSIDEYTYAFTNLGYNLMAWDYPGYGRSTNCWFSQQSLLNDAETAYQWLTKHENPNKIFIFGYSIGTGIALSVAAHHQQNPIFLVAPYDSLEKVAIDYLPPIFPVNLLIRYPMQTLLWVKAIKKPIYAIHGEQDKLIRPERVRALINQINENVHIEWVEEAGHTSNSLFEYRNHWLKRLLP